MNSQADQKAPQRKALFCSDCGDKLKDNHVCDIHAANKAEQAKHDAELLLKIRKKTLSQTMRKIKLAKQENQNSIIAVAVAEKSLKDIYKIREGWKDQLAKYNAQALATSLKLLNADGEELDPEDSDDEYSYDSKLLKTETEDAFAFLNKSIGKYQ